MNGRARSVRGVVVISTKQGIQHGVAYKSAEEAHKAIDVIKEFMAGAPPEKPIVFSTKRIHITGDGVADKMVPDFMVRNHEISAVVFHQLDEVAQSNVDFGQYDDDDTEESWA